MRRHWMWAALLAIGACGTGGRPLSANGEQLYEVSAVVLESPQHATELCMGLIGESYPPKCGGLALLGWDWEAVDNEESANGSTWGEYSVVGTFDGKAFTVIESPKPPHYEKVEYDFTPPCPKPLEGWEHPDPEKLSHEHEQAAIADAQGEPDFAGLWMYGEPQEGAEPAGYQDPATKVMNAAFTGDLKRHEAELREHWGGGLCLVLQKHTLARLREIQEDVGIFLMERDRQSTSRSSNVVKNVVEVHVVFATEEDRAALDQRYGEGVVVLTTALKPVSS